MSTGKLHHAKGCTIGRNAARGSMLATIRPVLAYWWHHVTCVKCLAHAPKSAALAAETRKP